MSIYPSLDLSVPLRFEPFFALWSILSPEAKAHRPWAAEGKRALSSPARAALAGLHDAAPVWLALGDLAGIRPPGVEMDDLLASLAQHSPTDFSEALLSVLLGSRPNARALTEGRAKIGDLSATVTPAAHQRLRFFGLDGTDAAGPMLRLAGDLIVDPAAIQEAALSALSHFWSDIFAEIWERLRPALTASLDSARASLGGADWWRQWQNRPGHQYLGLDLDLSAREFRSEARGLRLPFSRIAKVHVFPSAFNEIGIYPVLDGPTSRRHVYFPYFDSAVGVPPSRSRRMSALDRKSSADVAPVFRALGDATRFAIASLIAHQSMSASEIAQRLGLSRPTLTHHLKEMRRAGLVDESGDGRTRHLSLNRAAIEAISNQTIHILFESQPTDRLGRSRRQRKKPSS